MLSRLFFKSRVFSNHTFSEAFLSSLNYSKMKEGVQKPNVQIPVTSKSDEQRRYNKIVFAVGLIFGGCIINNFLLELLMRLNQI